MTRARMLTAMNAAGLTTTLHRKRSTGVYRCSARLGGLLAVAYSQLSQHAMRDALALARSYWPDRFAPSAPTKRQPERK